MTCESEDRDVSCMFEVSVTDDEHGRWALRNVTRGYFLGAAGDKLICTAKVPTDAELWTIHLAARPQVRCHMRLSFLFVPHISIRLGLSLWIPHPRTC